MPSIHEHFTDSTQFALWFGEKRVKNGVLGGFDGRPSSKVERGINALINGDETHVTQAQALVDSLTLQIETPRNSWYRDVYGCMPDVPSYLAGDPMNMWNMHKVTEDHAPIKVYFGLTSSAMISEETLVKRGCALAAFAIAMTNIRPVVITPFVTLGSGYSSRSRQMLISWEISTQPLILSELLAVTLPQVTRYVGIEACQQLFGQEATRDGHFHVDSFDEAKMRVHLNVAPADLYLPCVYGLDPLVDSPVEWVNEMVTRYTSGIATDLDNQPQEGQY